MAFRITTQEMYTGQPGNLQFDGPVRQYAIGLSRYRIEARADRYASGGPGVERVTLHLRHTWDPARPNEVRFDIEASIDGERCAGYGDRAWASCLVACIADVGDRADDTCAAFNNSDGPWDRRLAAPRFEQPILARFEGNRAGGQWSAQTWPGSIAIAATEGRTFCKALHLPRDVDTVDFADTIGAGVVVREAVAFMQQATFDFDQFALRQANNSVCLTGGAPDLFCRGSKVSFYPHGDVDLLLVVHTDSVVVGERSSVRIRVSEAPAGEGGYIWEWEVSPGHWHRISRTSDVLAWSPGSQRSELTVTASNNTSRPIVVTLDDQPFSDVAPGAESPQIHLGDARSGKVWGYFADNREKLPDPTFTPLKQGG